MSLKAPRHPICISSSSSPLHLYSDQDFLPRGEQKTLRRPLLSRMYSYRPLLPCHGFLTDAFYSAWCVWNKMKHQQHNEQRTELVLLCLFCRSLMLLLLLSLKSWRKVFLLAVFFLFFGYSSPAPEYACLSWYFRYHTQTIQGSSRFAPWRRCLFPPSLKIQRDGRRRRQGRQEESFVLIERMQNERETFEMILFVR